MTQFSAPLVGSAFRPAGKAILAALPAGCPLTLTLNPENPYDPDAIMVMLAPGDIPESQRPTLSEVLSASGLPPEDFFEGFDPYHLGFVANSEKTGGKFASDWSARLRAAVVSECPATLGFAADGKATVLSELV